MESAIQYDSIKVSEGAIFTFPSHEATLGKFSTLFVRIHSTDKWLKFDKK